MKSEYDKLSRMEVVMLAGSLSVLASTLMALGALVQ